VQCADPRVKLMVVGGSGTLTDQYRARCQTMGIASQVSFLGMQKDIRPFLWSADAFVLPSFYEVFPLVALEAAASALPLIVSPINGIEEFVIDGVNGIIVDQKSESIRRGIGRFLQSSPQDRAQMGAAAAASVQKYRTEEFVTRWKAFYAA
jgi:glycosyltransferase involved in cell wall biosynthesis